MFKEYEMTPLEMVAKIKAMKSIEDKMADVSNIDVVVHRVNPPYSPAKSEILSQLITQYTITSDNITHEEKPHGSSYQSIFMGVDSGEIGVTWYDLKRNDVVDMLTLISPRNFLALDDIPVVGKLMRGIKTIRSLINRSESAKQILVRGENEIRPILPQDGTYLLPYDYYFKIEITSREMDTITGMPLPTKLLDGEFVLDGSLTIERDVEGEGLARVTASFKPIC
jgi:hypothetical protein